MKPPHGGTAKGAGKKVLGCEVREGTAARRSAIYGPTPAQGAARRTAPCLEKPRVRALSILSTPSKKTRPRPMNGTMQKTRSIPARHTVADMGGASQERARTTASGLRGLVAIEFPPAPKENGQARPSLSISGRPDPGSCGRRLFKRAGARSRGALVCGPGRGKMARRPWAAPGCAHALTSAWPSSSGVPRM